MTSSFLDRPIPMSSSRFVKAYQSFGRSLRRPIPLTSRTWTPRPQLVICIPQSLADFHTLRHESGTKHMRPVDDRLDLQQTPLIASADPRRRWRAGGVRNEGLFRSSAAYRQSALIRNNRGSHARAIARESLEKLASSGRRQRLLIRRCQVRTLVRQPLSSEAAARRLETALPSGDQATRFTRYR
jgi:hypothetical protein